MGCPERMVETGRDEEEEYFKWSGPQECGWNDGEVGDETR